MVSILFEHRFWLQVLGDHARFIYNALAPTEPKEIQRAVAFVNALDGLLAHARQNLQPPGTETLHRQAYRLVKELKRYKLHLLRRNLTGTIAINMSPTFFNHMVNELEEYELLLTCLVSGHPLPPPYPIHQHLLWLSDATFHAVAIMGGLDGVEQDLLKHGNRFRQSFEALYIKSLEVKGYQRTGLHTFPALDRLNQQALAEITAFTDFLRELEQGRISKQILGNLPPLILDHMAREECYYLTKLAQGTDSKTPNCDPTRPRVTERL